MKQNSRFFLVTPWFGTFAGGGGRALTSLAKNIIRCGFEVTVLTTCSKSPYENWRQSVHEPGDVIIEGIPTKRFPVDQSDQAPYHEAVRTRLDGKPVPLELQLAFFSRGINSQALIGYVRTLEDDVIVIAGTYFQSLVPSLINTYPGKVIALPAFHDEPEFYWEPIKQLVNNSRKILFLSEEEKDLAIRVYGKTAGRHLVESPVIGLGVELPEGLETVPGNHDEIKSVRQQLQLPEFFLIYVGRLESSKGLSYLLPWMIGFNENREKQGEPIIPLVLIGDGPSGVVPNSPYLRKMGYLQDADKFAVMRAALALVNPSTLESFSYVVMEAWLVGTPVLVPQVCAVTAGHVIRSGGGLVYHDHEDFNRCILELMCDQTRQQMGKVGCRYVASHYRWGDVMDRFLRAVLT